MKRFVFFVCMISAVSFTVSASSPAVAESSPAVAAGRPGVEGGSLRHFLDDAKNYMFQRSCHFLGLSFHISHEPSVVNRDSDEDAGRYFDGLETKSDALLLKGGGSKTIFERIQKYETFDAQISERFFTQDGRPISTRDELRSYIASNFDGKDTKGNHVAVVSLVFEDVPDNILEDVCVIVYFSKEFSDKKLLERTTSEGAGMKEFLKGELLFLRKWGSDVFNLRYALCEAVEKKTDRTFRYRLVVRPRPDPISKAPSVAAASSAAPSMDDMCKKK